MSNNTTIPFLMTDWFNDCGIRNLCLAGNRFPEFHQALEL